MSDDGSETAWGCLKTLEDVRSPWVRALGTFSVVVATLIGVPQAVKIIRRKSSIGVSFWTLALGNVGGFLYVLNMYVFHYDQIVLSGSPFVDFKRWASAQTSLTFLWVELANTLSMLVVTPVAYAYVEDTEHAVVYKAPKLGIDVDWGMKKSVRMGMLAQIVLVASAWTPAVIALRRAGECAPLAWYGNVLGGVVALLICVRFLPQVRESYENKGSGSLSYVTYAVDISCGVVALLQKLLVTKERASTWIPPLVLHSMEAYVLVMNYRNDKAKMHEGREHRERDGQDASERGAGYGSEDERVQSERLLSRGNRSEAPTSPSGAGANNERSTKLSWSRLLDVFL